MKNWSEDEMNRKGNLKTKLAAVFSAGVLAVTGTASAVSGMTVSAQPSAGTYGDALKLSLYFFDANQCGADDNVLTWRGKCHTYDAEASLSSAKGLSSSSMAAAGAPVSFSLSRAAGTTLRSSSVACACFRRSSIL